MHLHLTRTVQIYNGMKKNEVLTMTKEQELMSFLHEKVFDPILSSPKASHSTKSGVHLTIARMNKLSADYNVKG